MDSWYCLSVPAGFRRADPELRVVPGQLVGPETSRQTFGGKNFLI